MKTYRFTVFILLCVLLAACRQDTPKLVGIVFERDHGSAWGNSFYIDVRVEEIAATRYFPEGSADQTIREHIPITAGQWQALTEVIQSMEWKERSGSWKEKLFGCAKLDSGESRNLTLVWETEKGTVETEYQWPQDKQADALEALLEQLAKAAP